MGSAPGGPVDGGTTEELPSGPEAIRVATFNIDWLSPRLSDPSDFAPRNEVDLAQLRGLVEAMDFTVVGLQEIEGTAAMQALGFDDRWDWVLGTSGWSQNLAILYRRDRVVVEDVREVPLPGTDFPSRNPLASRVSSDAWSFTLVVVHQNPYEDDDEAAYRYHQAEELRLWLDEEVADPSTQEVLVIGDFNDDFGGINERWPSLEVFESPPTWEFASREADSYSNIPFRSLIDHVLLSEAAAARWRALGGGCSVVEHDRVEPWSNYPGGYGGTQNLSSHRPVWIRY